MIRLRRSDERGHADHGWLKSAHTFSFANYYDANHMGFGNLRVINQDRVDAAKGFGTHGHRDMEIISYVLDGVLEHKDSMGNGSQMRAGEFQLMSAGTGVTHSEFNASETEPLHFLQMWINPKEQGTKPRYEQKEFDAKERQGKLRLVVSPDGAEGSIVIGQDARLYASLMSPEESTSQALAPDRMAWLHVARGKVKLNGQELGPGDGAAIEDEESLHFEGVEEADLVMWELPRA